MADIADVEAALVAAISAAIYPSGASSPSAVAVNGAAVACRVFPGWPVAANLDRDMTTSPPTLNVSVYQQAGMEKNTSRYERDWSDQFPVACSMTATVAGLTITIGGTVSVGHFIALQIGNTSFAYAAVANDTLATIATALAALVGNGFTASASGPVITVAQATAGGRITARTGAPGTSFMELERTNQRFLVTCWAPSNTYRVALARVVRSALAAIDTLVYADASCGRIVYENSNDVDRSAKQSLACRDLYYWVEYPTTQVIASAPVAAFSTGLEVDGPGSPDISPPPVADNRTITVLN